MNRKSQRIVLMLGSWFILTGLGCGLKRPFESGPGTLDQQRFTASVHDPYSDNDAGPEVVGGRPRDFNKPRAEPTRSRAWSDWFGMR